MIRSDLPGWLAAATVALGAAACSAAGPVTSDPCGPPVTFVSTQQGAATLFNGDRPLDFSTENVRYFDWDTSQVSVCSHAVVAEDSITFSVETGTPLPAGFLVTGIVYVGDPSHSIAYTVVLDRVATASGYTFTGTQKAFSLAGEVSSPSTELSGVIQVTFPAAGSRHTDSATVQTLIQKISYRFQYRSP